MKIIEKIENWKRDNGNSPFYSFEYFPPKTRTGILNLYYRMDRMATLNPIWVDITWRDGGVWGAETIELCANAIKYHGLEPLMHLSCTNMTKLDIKNVLDKCKENKIFNILALRGDPLLTQDKWEPTIGGFEHAIDLVRFIKSNYNDTFCIGVAGYPEGHLESANIEEDILHLKEKVDAGASFIITQMFFNVEKFKAFVKRCRDMNIKCYIFPGILPLQSYSGFFKMTSYCKTDVPTEILTPLESIKHDDEKVKDFGVYIGIKMCRELIDYGVNGLHFYTLNLENTTMRIIEGLNLGNTKRIFPWRPLEGRKEDVRPIFWSNRPRSYVDRTSTWDDFPNGRWGNSESPAFADPYPSVYTDPNERSIETRKLLWGEELKSIESIIDIFCKYLKRDSQVRRLPWCQDQPRPETFLIEKQLVQINHYGLLTINSQPRVNGSPSSDPIFGWGPNDGYVYQKAYIEFFCSPSALFKILDEIKSDANITYTAMNLSGACISNNPSKTNALTWGIFPGHEVKQPTVADVEAFFYWKDEAFQLWIEEWASIYNENSFSRELLTMIYKTWYLFNIVDNNFVTGDIFDKIIKIAKKKFIDPHTL